MKWLVAGFLLFASARVETPNRASPLHPGTSWRDHPVGVAVFQGSPSTTIDVVVRTMTYGVPRTLAGEYVALDRP
jgi:hypothetical protein